MCEILREYAKNEKHDKNIRIPAVIPIVLYNGKDVWDAQTELRKIFYNEEKFDNRVLNFNYDIFDVNNGFTKEELVNSKNVTAAIFLLDQKITPQEFLDRVKAIALFFDGLSNEELKAIKHWIKNTTEERLAIRAAEVLEASKEEVVNMVANNSFIIKEMEENAEERGRAKGRAEGKAEMLIKLLIKRFESLPNGYDEKIRNFSEETIDKVLTDIFDIVKIEDIEKYF